MGRLIDADRALEVVFEQGRAHPDAYHLTNYATLILREAPTVDADPVVRCRDCKNWDKDTYFCSWDGGNTGWFPEDYCSYGERKVGDGHGC